MKYQLAKELRGIENALAGPTVLLRINICATSKRCDVLRLRLANRVLGQVELSWSLYKRTTGAGIFSPARLRVARLWISVAMVSRSGEA